MTAADSWWLSLQIPAIGHGHRKPHFSSVSENSSLPLLQIRHETYQESGTSAVMAGSVAQ